MKNKLNLIIILLGIGILGYGYFEYTKYQEEQNRYATIKAEVESVQINDDNRVATFKYVVNGTTYSSSISTNQDLEVGNTKEIYYNKNAPDSIKINLITIVKSLLILSIGTLIVLLGLFLSIKNMMSKGRITRLKKKGIMINATIQEALVVPKDKGKNPYKIRAQYLNPQDNKTYFYESEETETDLKDLVSRKGLTTIPVYINSKNTDDYYVDLDSIR